MSDKINKIQEKAQTFALIGRRLTPSVMRSLATVAEFLKSRGHNAVYDEETAKNAENQANLTIMPLERIAEIAVAAIVLGGDGTMLGIGRSLAPYDVPIIGVNYGRLGFMADISLDIMIPVLSDILDGQFIAEKRTLLEGRVFREEQEIHNAIAFNEVVISRGAGSGLIELSVSVNERFMYSQRSDGLIVATPTGSTAYALSVGGPVLHPNLNGIVLASIAPHSLSNRPIVLPDSSEIVVQIVDARFPTVNFDSHSFASVHNKDRVIIRRSRCEATFIHPRNWSYYNTLRDKLGWNDRLHHSY